MSVPNEPNRDQPPMPPPGLPPNVPVKEPEPDTLPDEVPLPNPDENDQPPQHVRPVAYRNIWRSALTSSCK
ncbi:hypothetical protein AB4Z52_20585 [Rhizobium sp. 2YAF20]|uniref:hypothetical protein n=1 Tax=Rhizobium sp. 2YAF20 TaxID=3233027 RepID=UPI003F94E779